MNWEIPDVQDEFRNGRQISDQIAMPQQSEKKKK